jgi:hypothetical protein
MGDIMNKNDINGEKQKRRSKRNKKKIAIVILIIIVILIPLISYWYFFMRPITVEELYNREFKPGDSVEIIGEITDIEKHGTSYGELTLITLDDHEEASFVCQVMVDNEKTYKKGDEFTTTLHFDEYEFNGNKIVTAKKLFNTYLMPVYMTTVIDGVSFVGGILLELTSIDDKGTSTYEVLISDIEGLPIDIFNISLRKGTSTQNVEYTHKTSFDLFGSEWEKLSGEYQESEDIDFMKSLKDLVSENNMIEFEDVNSNGLLDDGDTFKVHIPPTADKRTIETYLLSIGGKPGSIIIYGRKYIINWYKGVYEWNPERFDKVNLILSYVSSEKNGTLSDTNLKIFKLLRGSAQHFQNYKFELFDHSYVSVLSGSIEPGVVIEGGVDDRISVEYIDNNKNSMLDVDDLFIIRGLENQTIYYFVIEDQKNEFLNMFEWIVGYGKIIGRLPPVELENKGLLPDSTNQLKVEADVSYWHPQLLLNSTLFLELRTNDINNESVRLLIVDGVVGVHNGVNITFSDADKDSLLSTGDFFVIETEPNNSYFVEILFFKYKPGWGIPMEPSKATNWLSPGLTINSDT